MDLATPRAIQLLKQLGATKAQAVMSLCAEPDSADGQMIRRIFTEN
jgi:hypothetical protein